MFKKGLVQRKLNVSELFFVSYVSVHPLLEIYTTDTIHTNLWFCFSNVYSMYHHTIWSHGILAANSASICADHQYHCLIVCCKPRSIHQDHHLH